MATVNKKFSVKNGLAVDGDVLVSNVSSFVVNGPTTGSLTFTLANVTSATINGNNIATEGWVGSQGYLTSFTETDPVFTASAAGGITGTQVTNWDTAYGWGNHASAGYLTSFTETDPVFVASTAYTIDSTDVSNWDTAYGWGNHASAGYLTSFTETDPVFTASEAYSITSTDTSNWDTAYGWGNHASAGYLTSAVESISNGDSNIVFSASSGSVTANLAANVTIGQNLTVTGNLTVNGNVTTLNTETLQVEDNIIVLNTNVTGTPSLDAGIEIERGDYTNAKIYWNETENKWYVSTPVDDSSAATNTAIALAGNVTLDNAAIVSGNANVTSGNVTAYSWNSGTYSTAKFTVQMKQGSDIHVLELLAAVAGSNVYVTEYAEIISNSPLGETDVTLSGGTATLTVTPVGGTVVTKIAATLINA
jgi:hypothetical protein